jgi:histidinol phosphatase-like enzyme
VGSDCCEIHHDFQDGTIVHTKSGADFARDAGDWKWWNKDTAAKLAEFAEDGYKVVIFT